MFPCAKGDSGTEGFVQLDAAQQELESFDEIISVVYANNHQELAPCLDGLGAEALQEASSANFSQMNFQGSNSGTCRILPFLVFVGGNGYRNYFISMQPSPIWIQILR